MPRGARSLRFLNTQISISDIFKVEHDFMLEGVFKTGIHLKPSRLGPLGRKYYFSPHLHISLKSQNKDLVSVGAHEKIFNSD